MKKLLSTLVVGLALFSFSCTLKYAPPPTPYIPKPPEQQQPLKKEEKKTVKGVYGYENIYLKNFYDLEFEKRDETYNLPSDLEKIIEGSDFFKSQVKVKDKERFKKNVLEIAKQLKYTEEQIRSLAPDEILELSAKIVAENYEYMNVYYNDKSIDEIFETKKIKCTDYTDSVIAVFNLFKEMNPNLNNVYVIDHQFCRFIGHAWNTIFVIGKKDIQIVYLDATWYDTKAAEDLNATDRWHIDFERWRSQFYAALNDYDSAQKELNPLIEKETDLKRLEMLLERSAAYYHMVRDYENSLKTYNKLLDEFPNSKDRDKYISNLGWIYYLIGDFEKLKDCIETLKKEHPNSYYKLDYLENIIKKEVS